MEFQRLIEQMVSSQLAARGIRDERVLEAMRRVPRHRFVGEDMVERAYEDAALPAGQGQTISQPYMVALMTELLGLRGGEKVLEVGTGSGYQAAILAELAAEVYTVDRLEELSLKAARRLASLGYENIHYIVGDGTLGHLEAAPYQGVLVTAGAPGIPPALAEQLDEGGSMVIPVGDLHSQTLIKATKEGGRLREERHIPCVFVPLVGAQGWRE